MKIAIYIILIALLFVLSAMFSCSDMAYSVVPLKRLESSAKSGSKSAVKALKLARNYDKTIVTVLFGNNLVNIAASSLGVLLSFELFGEQLYGEAIISGILLVIVLIFGEIMPKILAKTYPIFLSKWLSTFVMVCQVIFFPFVILSSKLVSALAKPITDKNEDDYVPSDDELAAMLDELESEGSLDEDKRELIESSIDFKDTSAYEIMTPRVKIEGIEIGTDLNKFVRKEGMFRHSRIPVYKKDLDHIVGFIPVKGLLRAMISASNLEIEDFILPIVYVPRTMEISSVLTLLKKSHRHIAIVKDEYGGTEGLLTLEDILEELVGELYDESETVKEDIVETKKRNVFAVRGKTDIEVFFERFGLNDEKLDSDYETVSGWIVDKLGRFAVKGDKLTYGKVDIKVKKANQFTIDEIEVWFHPRRKEKED